jgi:peptidoglycan hydrolase-like protein with peptidoglycan-binding domain
MANLQLLNQLVVTNSSEVHLRGGLMNQYVVELQHLLRRLGYERELMWSVYGADGYYGATVMSAVRAFATRAGVSHNGQSVPPFLLQRMIQAAGSTTPTPPGGGGSTTPPVGGGGTPPPSVGSLRVNDQGDSILVSDGSKQATFRKRDAGLVHYGTISIEQAINQNSGIIQSLGITPSALNVMKSVSENEGKIDSINTYDRAYLSVGIFQWTIGAGDGAGELPALLRKFKRSFANEFRAYLGAAGLDVSPDTTDTSGFFTLNGAKIERGAQKEQFRGPEWAFRFWLAGQDPRMHAVQIEHALSRLRQFYWTNRQAVNGFTLSEIITSEYGVALLLDHHVNRPSYVQPSVQQAMQQTGLNNPTFWSTAEERRVIDAYLNIRATFTTGTAAPMTKAHERAAVTKRYLDQRIISAERQSFHYSQQMVG